MLGVGGGQTSPVTCGTKGAVRFPTVDIGTCVLSAEVIIGPSNAPASSVGGHQLTFLQGVQATHHHGARGGISLLLPLSLNKCVSDLELYSTVLMIIITLPRSSHYCIMCYLYSWVGLWLLLADTLYIITFLGVDKGYNKETGETMQEGRGGTTA